MEFDSGPLVDAGFAAHRIDVGFMGDLPASLAAKSGLPVKAIMVDKAIGAGEYLLAEPGITSIAQLRGKPVAYTTGTAEQAFALRALEARVGLYYPGRRAPGEREPGAARHRAAVRCGGRVRRERRAEGFDYQLAHPDSAVLATIQTVTPPSYGYLLATTRAALADQAKRAGRHRRPQQADHQGGELGEDTPEPVHHRLLRGRRAPDNAGGQADPRHAAALQTYIPITPKACSRRCSRWST